MAHWTARQLIVLVLGITLALGTTLANVQAADMAMKISADAPMTAMTPGSCDPCGGDEAASAGSCVMACPRPVQALDSAAAPVVLTKTRGVRPSDEFALAGRSSHPDPHPPKSVILS